MSDNEDLEVLKEELESRTYAAIANILKIYATTYYTRFNNTLELNNTLLRTTAKMVGEMIACYPGEERESVSEWVIEEIIMAELNMVATLEERAAESETPTADMPKEKYDLARMKPQGRC